MSSIPAILDGVANNANIFEFMPLLAPSSLKDRAAVYVALSGLALLLTTIVFFMLAIKDKNVTIVETIKKNAGMATMSFISWTALLLIVIAQSIQLNGAMQEEEKQRHSSPSPSKK